MPTSARRPPFPAARRTAQPHAGDAVELNRIILNSIVDHAIVTLDRDGHVTSWNEGAEKILGWTEGEIVGRSADVFFTPEDVALDRPETEMRLALSEGRADDERWHVRKSGERFFASGLMMPLVSGPPDGPGDPGDHHGFLKVFRDQTAKHIADAKIARLESRTALALRGSSAMGLWDCDLHENLVTCDAATAVLHGMEPEHARDGAPTEDFMARVYDEDRVALRDAMADAAARGSEIDVRYRIAGDDKRPRWLHTRGVVQKDSSGRFARLSGIVSDITADWERRRLQDVRLAFSDAVREETGIDAIRQLAARTIGEALGASTVVYVRIDGPDSAATAVPGRWTDDGSGDAAVPADAIGRAMPDLRRGRIVAVAGDDAEGGCGATGRAGARSVMMVPRVKSGTLRGVLAVTDGDGHAWTEDETSFVRAVQDRAQASVDSARSGQERDMMVAELSHRIKNMLTIARIVAMQSLRAAATIDDARTSIAARLGALARAQDVLTRSHQSGAPIRAVVQDVLAPHMPAGDRVKVAGPDLRLGPQQVMGLSLALHELAVNAAKYGALSVPAGRVGIDWSSDTASFAFRWRETGGPTVTPPQRTGFGTVILDRIAGGYFSGTSQVRYRAEGIAFAIDGRLDGDRIE